MGKFQWLGSFLLSNSINVFLRAAVIEDFYGFYGC